MEGRGDTDRWIVGREKENRSPSTATGPVRRGAAVRCVADRLGVRRNAAGATRRARPTPTARTFNRPPAPVHVVFLRLSRSAARLVSWSPGAALNAARDAQIAIKMRFRIDVNCAYYFGELVAKGLDSQAAT